MSVLEQYTELKHLVRSHEQHAAEIKAIKATSAAEVLSARAEADGARAAMDAAMQELNKLKAEVAALRSKQRERKSAADSSKSSAASAAADAAKQDAARFTMELCLFREAAAADVLEAKSAAQAEHAATEAKWAAEAEAMRQHAATRSERHAARLRDVIASEEAWRASVVTLEGRLRAMALLALSLCVRAIRAERARKTHQTHERTLTVEVRQMDRRFVAIEEARQASAAGAALATAAAETEVRA
jgi:chemosensory pili system protein ChpA (sensor histidine kinase/response regulator)